jgi:hypothetical protein
MGTSNNCVFGMPVGHFQDKTHPFLTLFQGKGWVYRCALITILILVQVALAGQASFNIDNITIAKYEKYTLKGLNTDQKELSYVIEYNVKEDQQAKKKTWEISSTQMLGGSRTDSTVVIRLADLQPSYSKSVRTYDEGSYADTYELANERIANDDPKVFFFANPQMLLYVLRTYPFASETKEISVRTFGSKAGGFNMTVKNNGVKKLKLKNGDACDAYELELGVDIAFWSAFIPKSYYYFKNDPQKTFIKFRGAIMPGSKEIEMELESYSVKN